MAFYEIMLFRPVSRVRFASLLTALFAGNACAIGLGEIAVRSALGQTFRAEIPVSTSSGEAVPPRECFRIVMPAEDTGGIPTLMPAQASTMLERTGGKTLLVIRSQRAVSEPVLQLSVAAGCGGELVRDYQILLDPVASAPRVTTMSAGPGPSSTAAREVSPASVRDAADDAYPSRWRTNGSETAWSITRTLFPRQPRAQRRFYDALLAANPGVEFGTAGDQPPAANIDLTIPDTRRTRRAAPPVASSPTATPAATAAAASPARDSIPVREKSRQERKPIDRLVISGGSPELLPDVSAVPATSVQDSLPPAATPDSLMLRLTEILPLHDSARTTDNQRNLLRMEYQLLARLQAQGEQQLALAEKVRALEAATLGLDSSVRAALAARERVAAGQSAVPGGLTGTPVLASGSSSLAIAPQSVQPPSSFPWLWLTGLPVFAALAWYAYRRRQRPGPTWNWPERMAAAPATTATDDFVFDEPVTQIMTRPSALPANPVPPPSPIVSHDPGAHSLSEIELVEDAEFANVVELADVLLAFGRTKGAIQALEEVIHANPKGSLRPWLKLLEVFRAQGMREDFDELAERMKTHFNLVSPDWDEIGDSSVANGAALNDPLTESFDAILSHLPSIAALPHVAAALRRSWDTPEGLEYLNALLRDNRNGERIGFSLTAVSGLIFLHDIQVARLAKAA